MANTKAILPEDCPHGDHNAEWIEMPAFNMVYCHHLYGTPSGCMWPVNMWTEGSDAYASGNASVIMWKNAWSL